MKSIIWFRNDLRIDDNPAMRAACDNSTEVHAIFLYSKNQLEKHNEANVKLDFLIQNLKSLSDRLNGLNIPLSVIASKGFDEEPETILKTVKERVPSADTDPHDVEQDEHGTICRVFLSAQQRAGLGGVRDAISQFALLSDNNAISNQNIQPE